MIGVDVDARKVEAIEAGESYIEDVPSERLGRGGRAHRGHHALRDAGAMPTPCSICVPTPLTPQPRARPRPAGRAPGAALADVLQAGQLVVLESTTYPGTTRERLRRRCSRSPGLPAGRDFHLAFSPERVDPGRTDYTMRNTPKVVGGLTEACGERAEALYGHVCDEIVRVSTPGGRPS